MKKRFFYTLFLVVIISSVLAGGFFMILSAGLKKAHKDFQGKLNYIISDKQYYKTVFIGSSRVYNQINSLLFDSLAHADSYNAGIEGARIAEMEVFLKKYVHSHGAPQYLFLSLDESALLTDHVWDFPRLFPYVSDPDVFELYKYQHEILLAKYLPPIALTFYDDSRKMLALGSLIKNTAAYTNAGNRGFEALPNVPVLNPSPALTEQYYYSEAGIKALNRICDLCKRENTKVIFLIAPRLISPKLVNAGNKPYEKISAIAQQFDIPVIDFSHYEQFVNARLFYDNTHLTGKGADLYTMLIAGEFEKMHLNQGNVLK